MRRWYNGGMSETRKKADWLIVAGLALAVVLVPLGLYVGGYFALGSRKDVMFDRDNDGTSGWMICIRAFDYDWMAQAYSPAAKVESFLTGGKVETRSPR